MAFVVTPYNARESVAWVMKNVTGFVRKNPGGVASMPDTFDLNDGVGPHAGCALSAVLRR